MADRSSHNRMRLEFPNLPENVAFARTTVACFAAQVEFTLDELDEIKVATSEAVSNAVLHAYRNGQGTVVVEASLSGDVLELRVSDEGAGIADVSWALEPGHTTDADERMGLGLVFIREYMNAMEVRSSPGRGTQVHMRKARQKGSR